MLTTSCILLFAQFRIGTRWATWPLLLGMLLSAMVAQLVSISGVCGIREAGMIAAALAAGAIATRRLQQAQTPLTHWLSCAKHVVRENLEYLAGCGAQGRGVLAYLTGSAVVLLVYGLLYLPVPMDNYNPVHSELIARHDSLFVGPVFHPFIVSVGFLHEYMLADLQLTPWVGGWLARMVPCLTSLCFSSLLIAFAQRRDPFGKLLWVWPAIATLPMFLWSDASLYKNDLLVAALSFPPLFAVSKRISLNDREWLLQLGLLCGLAIAAKLTALFVAVVLMAFMPWRPKGRSAVDRGVVGFGIVIGAAGSGLLFVVLGNWVLFGSTLGPIAGAPMFHGGIEHRMQGIGFFLQSVFDPRNTIVSPFMRARGAFGGLTFSRKDLSLLFECCLLILAYLGIRRKAPRRPSGVALTTIGLNAILNHDLLIDHRYLIAPAILVFLEAPAAAAGGGRLVGDRLLRVILLAAAAFVLIQSAATQVTLLSYEVALRDRSSWYGKLVVSLRGRAGAEPSAIRRVHASMLYMQELNEVARLSASVANATEEYYFVLRGISYRQIRAWTHPAGQPSALRWDLANLDRYDLIILGPDTTPLPATLAAHLRARCIFLVPSAGIQSGASYKVRGFRCAAPGGTFARHYEVGRPSPISTRGKKCPVRVRQGPVTPALERRIGD